MAIEIERTFLLANDGWRDAVVRTSHLTDGLIARADGRKVRVRLSGRQAWLTVKGPRQGISRFEFEYEIPYPDGLIMLQSLCAGPSIEKIRHLVPFAGFDWSVDIHLGLLTGTDLAEVELQHVDDDMPLPPWIGREVTHEPSLRKEALLARCVAAMAVASSLPGSLQ
ncbi:CYTH domain-containing protein [Glacieibacterium sp.]|uniref:CYTH domain-containing protein n=1 Tax=Glacieibacterium sp. TaxID=2860237 RepID=UPI003AFFD568